MKKYTRIINFHILGFIVVLVTGATSCCVKEKPIDFYKAEQMLQNGSFDDLHCWVQDVRCDLDSGSCNYQRVDSLLQLAQRIVLEYPYGRECVKEQLEASVGSFSEQSLVEWEEGGLLEWRFINGEKRYFKRAVSNFILLRSGELNGMADSVLVNLSLVHTNKVVNDVKRNGELVLPQSFDVTYRIIVEADAVPGGEIVRCWMPWPKEDHPRQTAVMLKTASEPKYVIASDACVHRSFYMEKQAQMGEETVFEVSFSYQSYAQFFAADKIGVKPYNKESEVYKKYTAEQLPHIVFSDRVKDLADSITRGASNPIEIVRQLYYWIDHTIPWTGALEYGIIPCMPEYVLDNKRGDCGMQTLLFMSMARYLGIPVRWQSGWMMHTERVNLHDWCEVYYEGVGWVPLDITFNLQDSEIKKIKEFYLTGIDAYRLIVNDGIGGEFYPAKKFLRSEPWDFQRGEVEWRGGNLYFDQWSYQMIIND